MPPSFYWALFLAAGALALVLAKRLDDRDGKRRGESPPVQT